ncbi:hypothetical protein [Aliiroseovarius subalbicans]|uniref:hypothetical protein n=1 Tax=Aliiroseovarius subalbicans TaxID=2925840 RepID=UPI001F5A7501|nr:hypothetical protein [Aliiroseovarius subalbicans]MCI2398230.1 hypothetical protein [Aliiroseovarius subalbicans]
MIVIAAAILGGILGYRNAAKRGGNRLDKLQYTVVYGIAFTLVALFVTVFIDRSL